MKKKGEDSRDPILHVLYGRYRIKPRAGLSTASNWIRNLFGFLFLFYFLWNDNFNS